MKIASDPVPMNGDAGGNAGPESRPPLLGPGDPPPVGVVNPNGRSPFLLIGDHAGNRLPSSLGTLGLSEEDLSRHIAWDIGVRSLGELLSEALDAVFLHQRYSRLVADCNRDAGWDSVIPPVSDGTHIPGNRDLSEQQRKERIDAIHEPYQRAIGAELDRCSRGGQGTILISLHSFTPALRTVGSERPWQIGVLYDGGDTSFATVLLEALRRRGDLNVGENEPYAMTGSDHTIPRHAYPSRIPYAELEIRQDLLERRSGLLEWSERLCATLHRALHELGDPLQAVGPGASPPDEI